MIIIRVCLILCLANISTVFAKDVLIPIESLKIPEESAYYLISIGINQYNDSFWPELKWPVKDATKVVDQFGNNTGYKVHKKILIDENASLETVTETLINISRQANYNDNVILYFSGHGTLQQNDRGDLARIVVMHDTHNDDLLNTGLSHAWLRQWLDSLKAKKKMIVFATCNSGVGKSRVPVSIERLLASRKGKLIPLEEVSEGALILAAAAKGEAAREDDNLKGDIYTHFLLESLDLYDRNRDGMVSALEAHDYAREKTWTYTRGKQRPTADIELIGNADIPLAGQKSRSALPVLEAYSEELAGFRVKVDQQEKGRLPLAFALDPNGSEITLFPPLSDEPLARYNVNINQGQTVNLEHVINYRPLGFSIDYGFSYWRDPAWQRLSGTSVSNDLSIKTYWQEKNVSIGLNYLKSIFSREGEIRHNLDSSAEYTQYALFVAYSHLWQRFKFQISANIGNERMELMLQDSVSKEKLNFHEQSVTQGLALLIAREVYPQLNLGLAIGVQFSQWDFGTLGKLNGERNWFALNLHYQFHWRYWTK